NRVNLTAPQARRPNKAAQLVITSLGESPQHTSLTASATAAQRLPLPPGAKDNPLPLSERIATLEARLAHQKQLYAKRPRISFVDAASTLASYEAGYINHFRERVEAIGTRH